MTKDFDSRNLANDWGPRSGTDTVFLRFLPIPGDVDGRAKDIVDRTSDRGRVQNPIEPQKRLVQRLIRVVYRPQAPRELFDKGAIVLHKLPTQSRSIGIT